MEISVITYDSNRTKKWVKGVYRDREEAIEWVEEVAIPRIGGDWDKTESDKIISYELTEETNNIEWAKYKIQERPVQ
ncbi:hypothetical protein ACAH01_11680 [Halomicrobium sp. HM KBTZ05]|uniref:hypothetical protein n=1 Tax=Halomicrobium sp. HM KBTZ05 TaxID=3242663 RepID=UPI003556E392